MKNPRKSILLLILFVSAFLTGCSNISIRTSIVIDAPPEKVYSVLAAIESYPDWNPYHKKIEGEFKEGAKLKVYVTRPDGKKVEVPPHMMKIEKNKEITWGGGIKGIFYGVHSFRLSEMKDGRTILRHDEDFSGFAINFADLPPDVIAQGYQEMNMALKKKVENVRSVGN
jgi:hypothetical protein